MNRLKLKRKLNKRKTIIIIINIILIILGLLYPSIIEKSTISTKLTTYIENIINSKYLIEALIKTNIINNISEVLLLSLNTIFIITFPISILLYFTKSFSLGVSISSLIYFYKLKGLLFSIIIGIPSIINLILISILFYYSITYFIIFIKSKSKIRKKKLLKEYLKVILIVLVLNIILSIIDSYLSFYLFKLFK